MNEKILELGLRLKSARLRRNDPQKEFAYRIGVSIPTLYKMEHGDPSISVGKWVKALGILGRLDDLDKLIAPQESLADRYAASRKVHMRQRARRTKGSSPIKKPSQIKRF